MIGLFFEVTPRDGHAENYFDLAAALKPELERSGGVVFIDRYRSVDRPNVILSHQWWADEEALVRWRGHAQHQAIQRAGREQHFRDYRIRIGPEVDPTRARSAARAVWVSYYDVEPARPVAGELFKSVYREEKFLALSEGEPGAHVVSSDRKAFEIMRDYSMYDRTEAPQSYPPVERR
jgi:heme-degrading monooxygenase HmoA